jgi:hypothetical protein
MEDPTSISNTTGSLGLPPSAPSIARKSHTHTSESSPKQSALSLAKEEDHHLSPTSSQFLDLIEKFKNHPLAPAQDLVPTNENPRIDAIKRAEEFLLKDSWPSQETLDCLAHILTENFE